MQVRARVGWCRAGRALFLLLAAVGPWSAAPAAQSSAAATPAVPAASTTLSLRGTIERSDPSTRTLSLATPHGRVRLILPLAARIRLGWRKVDVADLRRLAGDRATVRYTDAGGNPTVESVHVFGK